MQQEVERFRKSIEPWLNTYDRIAVSAMGIHEGNKKLLLSARIVLAPSVAPPYHVPRLNDSIFWAVAETTSFSKKSWGQLLDQLVTGTLGVGKLQASLAQDATSTPNLSYRSDPHSANGGNQSAARFVTLSLTGGSRASAIGRATNYVEVDWYLRSHNPPFSDLSDLHAYYGLPSPFEANDSSLVEIVARPPMEMDQRSIIENGTARIRVLSSKKAYRKSISVGFRGIGSSANQLRETVSANQFTWTETDRLFEGEALVEVGDTPTLQCFLSYAGSGIQQWWVHDPQRLLNPRLAIHAAFDTNQTVLKRLLFESKKSDSRSFEDGVAMLMSMLGFAVTQHGRSQKLSDAPDIIAITPAGHVTVVECTVGLPDQDDQIAKVLQRAEAIRKSLASSGWREVQILPIVVTSLSESEIQGHKKDAESQGVVVACLENIQRALTQVQFPVDTDRLFREAVQRLRMLPMVFGAPLRNSLI